MKLNYIVVGTGRCGTVYMARLLTHLGLCCGHESIFDWQGLDVAKMRLNGEKPVCLSHTSVTEYNPGTDQINSMTPWITDFSKLQADSSYLAAPYLLDALFDDVLKIHLVRHPVRVVNSFCNYIFYFQTAKANNQYERFIYKQFPELCQEMSKYDRACLFYILWNELIEKGSPHHFHRIEDSPQELLRSLKLPGQELAKKDINTYKKMKSERFSLNMVQSKEISERFVEIGVRYGYKITSDYLLI